MIPMKNPCCGKCNERCEAYSAEVERDEQGGIYDWFSECCRAECYEGPAEKEEEVEE